MKKLGVLLALLALGIFASYIYARLRVDIPRVAVINAHKGLEGYAARHGSYEGATIDSLGVQAHATDLHLVPLDSSRVRIEAVDRSNGRRCWLETAPNEGGEPQCIPSSR